MAGAPEEPQPGALRPDEERFRTILEHAPVMIDSFDEHGTCILWNHECVRRLGWTQAELSELSEPLAVFYPDPDILQTVKEDIARGDGVFREYPVLAKDGSRRRQLWANFRTPETGSTIAVGHDVTEQREVERQLRQAQKMEALGRLTGGIAHDFNNLLTVIFAGAELLLHEVTAGTLADELTRQIRQAAQDGSDLVRQLGSLGPQSRFEPVPVDLDALLDDLAPTLRRLLPETIEIYVQHEPGPRCVSGDRTALKQVFVNLATNARDAIDGRGRIDIATRTVTSGSREHAVVSIRDSGHGMAPELRERVFEPFFTTKPRGKGTGLGLPTVYGLVARHGGTVELSSEVGHGTCVEVRLPTIERPLGSDEGADGGDGLLPRGSESILLVEDDAGTRAIARSILEHLGYRVVSAEDGVRALEVLAERPDVDLVLSDVVMPRMTGPELHARLRDGGAPMPRFAFWTGYAPREMAAQLDPAIPVLQKPWSLPALAAFVRRCLDAS